MVIYISAKLNRCILIISFLLLVGLPGSISAVAQTPGDTAQAPANSHAQSVIDFWTPERVAAAQPMRRVVDDRGLPYISGSDGAFVPLGHSSAMQSTVGIALSAGVTTHVTGDEAPIISDLSPNFLTVDLPVTFQFKVEAIDPETATVEIDLQMYDPFVQTDDAGFEMTMQRGGLRAATYLGDDVWEYELTETVPENVYTWRVLVTQGNGTKTWSSVAIMGIEVPDLADRPDETILSAWGNGGDVQTAVGRLLYEMYVEDEFGVAEWRYYLCTGSAINDGVSGRSIILTAAHCIFNEQTQTFTRNVLFIPNQAETTGGRTDFDCHNDPLGCWVVSFGVIDRMWARRGFDPNTAPELRVTNHPWDFGYYVVEDSRAHFGAELDSEALDEVVPALTVDFKAPDLNDGASGNGWAYALGYEGRFDPALTYCADGLTIENNHMQYYVFHLPYCGLVGGSSGGPILSGFSVDDGVGKIVSLNSFGFSGLLGMRGPQLYRHTAKCRLEEAKTVAFDSILRQTGSEGYFSESDCRFWFWGFTNR